MFELMARFSETGATRLRNQIVDLRAQQLELVSTTDSLRTAYLYLSFGLLAAGAMATRFGNALRAVVETNIEAFRAFEHQTVITGSLMGKFDDQTLQLREEFLELGKVTEWTSVQAAEAGRIFALAGKEFEEEGEAFKVVGAALTMATVGLASHTEAARFAIDVTNQFGIELDEVGGIIELTTAAITKSNLTLQELATSMSYAGAASFEFGISLADTTAYMMASADAGIRGGRAGRYWREGITRVSKALGVAGKGTIAFTEASELLRKANENAEVGIYDLNNEFSSLTNMVDVLNDAFGDLDESVRAVYLSALFGARNWATWAALMRKAKEAEEDHTKEGIKPMVDALEASQAVWAIQEKTTLDGKDALRDLMVQWVNSDKKMIEFDETFKDFSDTQKDWIRDAISHIGTLEELDKAYESLHMSQFIAQKRLEDLHGTIILYESSLDKLRVMMAGPLVGVYKKWYESLKLIVDALAEVHPVILGFISIFALTVGLLASFGGQIAMAVGGIFMLIAALAILVKQREANVTLIRMAIPTMKLYNREVNWGVKVNTQYFSSQALVSKGFKLLTTQAILMSKQFRLVGMAMARQMIFMAGPMLLSMLILQESTKEGNEWMSRWGLMMMFVMTPAIQLLTFSFEKLTLAQIKNRAAMMLNYVMAKPLAVAKLFLATSTMKSAAATYVETSATVKSTTAKIWNKAVTILQIAANWLLMASLFVAVPVYGIATIALAKLTSTQIWQNMVALVSIARTKLHALANWLLTLSYVGMIPGILGAAAATTILAIVSAPLWLILLGVAAVIATIVVLFLKWEVITKKLGKIIETVFIKRKSPAFWEALQLSAKYSAENVKNFERWARVADRLRGVSIGVPEVTEFPEVADRLKAMRISTLEAAEGIGGARKGVQVNMFSGARISLTKEALPGFKSIVDEAVSATLSKLERML